MKGEVLERLANSPLFALIKDWLEEERGDLNE